MLNTNTSYGITSNTTPKTIASNQWYSSLYQKFPSQPLFAFPLVFQLTEKGVGFSYPKIAKTPDTIFGSFTEDLSVGLSENLTKPQIQQIGYWNINLQMNESNEKYLKFTLAQGIPWTVFHTNDDHIYLHLKHSYIFFNNGTTENKNDTIVTTDAFRININDNNYIVVLPMKEKIQITSREIIIPSNRIFIGILDTPKNYKLFKDNGKAEITDTTITWKRDEDTLLTTYTFLGNKITPLITLFPHQYDTLTKKPEVFGTYQTLRGMLHLVKTSSFITSTPIIRPEISFSKLQINHDDFIATLKEDQQKIIHDNQNTNGDYFLGAWYGKAATILQLLEAAGLEKEKEELISFLKPRFTDSLSHFIYQNDLQSMIAEKPEFGNEKLNDHHFHYGYYIRTAAILSNMDPTYKEKISKKINDLVGDIATTQKKSNKFPFLRNFNNYEGHSYADGFADFGDGNNQESSSEAMNAWYSIYLWSLVSKNKDLENTALYLYNTELQGVKYYWFGENNMYTTPYDHAIASLVWGGKVDFSTWFSNKTNMKYGIQILPVTPGSFSYLGTFNKFDLYEKDFYNHAGNINDEWGDLFSIFTSFYNADKALSYKDQVTKPEANTPKSLFLYTLYKNNEK